MLKSILSVFCSIIIVICSIVQFHHHDNDGKMVVFSVSEHVCSDSHEHEPMCGVNHSPQSHGCQDGHHQDEKNCSLKINIAKIEKKSIPQIVISCVLIDNTLSDISQIENHFLIPWDESFISRDCIGIHLLRAPPVA